VDAHFGSHFGVFFRVLFIAQALNLLVPVRLGELARLGLMQEAGKPVGTTLGSIALEKSLDLLAVGIVLLVVAPLAGAPAWLDVGVGPRALLTALALTGLLALLAAVRRPLFARIQALPTPRLPLLSWAVTRLLAVARGFIDSLAGLEPGRLARVLALTALVWVLSSLVIQSLFVACAFPLGFQTAALLMGALMFSNLAPTPPAMIGIVGAVAALVLAPFGLPAAQVTAFGILLNAVIVGPPVLIGGALAGGWAARLLSSARAARPLPQALGLAGPPSAGDKP